MFTPDAPQLPGTNPMEMGMQPPTPEPVDTEKHEIDRALSEINLAERLREQDKRKGTTELEKIGSLVCRDYDSDEASRTDWMKRNEEWMKLATQVVEHKTFPWDGAANVKYPLLSMAALQFSARAYSSLIPSLDVVKAKVAGPDPDGALTDKANALSTHMSVQVMHEMDDWEEDMDRLMFVLPIAGCMFKKIYYSEIQGKNVAELVSAKDFVVNYYTKTLKKSPRYTHIQFYTPNEIKEFQNYGIFLEYDEPFGPGQGEDRSTTGDSSTTGLSADQGGEDDDTPRKVLEQYRYLDLDEDGYREPYIVTVDYQTKRVLRIAPNFRLDDVKRGEDGEIQCISPCAWFVKYGFIPNPDGGFYDIGFGLLLGGINESVNTLTNQLLDAGTLNNLNAGFLAKGLRLGGKDLKFKAGEWKVVNAIGDDLRKSIMPLPANPPSPVLFELLGTLAQAGKELASVAEIFTGKLPGQNTPAATTMATIEQGLKVFTSIYKRIYRSLQQEFVLLFKLNQLYTPTEITRFVAEVNGESKEYQVSRHDYQEAKVRILPAADPNMVSETQKLMKLQGLQEFAQFGHINTQEMTRQALVYQGQENIQALMNVPPPPPPIEIQIQQMKDAQAEKDRQLEMMTIMSESQKRQSEIVLNLAKAKQLGDEMGAMMLEAQLKREEAAMDIQMKLIEMMFKQKEHQMDLQMKKEEHDLDMQVKTITGAQDVEMNEALNEQTLRHNEINMGQKLAHGEAEGKQKLDLSKKAGDQKLEQMKAQNKEKQKNASKGAK